MMKMEATEFFNVISKIVYFFQSILWTKVLIITTTKNNLNHSIYNLRKR